jgi:hypothetical protein
MGTPHAGPCYTPGTLSAVRLWQVADPFYGELVNPKSRPTYGHPPIRTGCPLSCAQRTACRRRGDLPWSEWDTTKSGQSSKTFQQIALRRCWSLRTSSRTSVGIRSRCQSRSWTRADSASLAEAEATAALIAYAAAPRSWAATWATATACPAARAADFAGSGSPRAAAFATKRPDAHHACTPRHRSRNDRCR